MPPRRIAWPLAWVLCLYPVWWVLGFGQFAFVLVAIPMGYQLLHRRPLRVPPGFGIWLLYLLWNVLSLIMVPVGTPLATNGSVSGRLISIILKSLELLSATVVGLYVLNLRESEVPTERILKWLTVLFVVTVAGGFLGLVAPHLKFSAPLEHLLPGRIRSNTYVAALVHPTAAQVQNVLGHSSPRPAAPWGYTNFWGNEISLLLVWSLLYWRSSRRRRTRLLLGVTTALAIIPVIYSLNRGLWFGLILSAAYALWRVTRGGDLRKPMAALALVPVLGVVFFATPLHTVVSQRASHGTSNDLRGFLDAQAVKGAVHSPILGWGDSRKAIGGPQSIAVGPTPNCFNCGGAGIGSTGEIWQVMFSQGFVGAGLYVGFFGLAFLGLRRNRTTVGSAARLSILLTVFYTFFYNNLPVGLTLAMISIAIASRPPDAGGAGTVTDGDPGTALPPPLSRPTLSGTPA